MSAIKNIFFMGFSSAIRIISGLLSFAILARVLGPEKFGQLMLWFSVATLLGLIANYGLTPYLLRELSLKKSHLSALFGDVLTGKLLLSGVILLITFAYVMVFGLDHPIAFLLLCVAMQLDSLTELFNACYRATNRFSSETKITSFASFLQLMFIVAVAYYSPTILAVSLVIMCSRFIASVMTWRDQRQYLKGIPLGGIKAGVKQLKRAWYFAVDFFLQSLMGQVDSLVISTYLGVSAVGIYQAGMRVFLGFAQSANVLSNVFIPRLSNAHNKKQEQQQETGYVQFSFILAGVFFGLFMVLAAEQLTKWIYGTAYLGLAELFPWLGLLFFIRFNVASLGVILTSAGMQKFRTGANALIWLLILSSIIIFIPKLGLQGWVVSLIFGNLVLGFIYVVKVMTTLGIQTKIMLCSGLGAIVFIPIFLMKIS